MKDPRHLYCELCSSKATKVQADYRSSPISIFVACASDLHAEVKIPMLRLFSDCIDLADSNGDGWTVHEWLKKTYARERVPISHNSITWLLSATANEEYVEFSSRNIWSALQHAVRSVLCHERHSRFLENILDLSDSERKAVSQQHLDAIGLLMAFRVSGRVLLPMVVAAGSFLQISGFDWVKDDVTHRQYLKTLPTIYTAWCHALLHCIQNVEKYMRLELDQYLWQLGFTRDEFVDALSRHNTDNRCSDQQIPSSTCTRCDNNYGSLPSALVTPVCIAVTECVKTHHKFDCVCQEAYESGFAAMYTEQAEYTGVCVDDSDGEDSENDEEFFDTEQYPFSEPSLTGQSTSSIFSDVATLLYRSHGRVWLGEYAVEDRLCATCFLLQERYTDKDGFIADFPPLPVNYNGLRFRW